LTLGFAMLAIGLNLTLGYAGQISLCHAAFMAFGSYAVAILGQRGVPFEIGLVIGVTVAFAWGLVLGFPALKVKHHYLAMVTLGFNIIVFLVLRNWESLTGGSFGISNVARPAWGRLSFQPDRAYYFYILAWAAVVVAVAYWILTSRWGRAFRAIRENEMRAEVVGVNLRNYKLMAFAVGAAYAGMGGALFAPLVGYIDPGAYTLDRSIQFLMMVVLGELLGLIGPNGSGKTTLFNCVTGVLRPSAGQVFLRGEDITGRSADVVYRRGIARTFQLIQLFPEMTVLDNMLVSGQEKTG